MNKQKTDIFKKLSHMTEAEQEEISRRCPPLDKNELSEIADAVEIELDEKQELADVYCDTVDELEECENVKWYRRPFFSFAMTAAAALVIGGIMWAGLGSGIRRGQMAETGDISQDASVADEVFPEVETEAPDEPEMPRGRAADGSDGEYSILIQEDQVIVEDNDPIMAKTRGLWRLDGGMAQYYILMDGAGSFSTFQRSGELIHSGKLSVKWGEGDDEGRVFYVMDEDGAKFFFVNDKRLCLGDEQYKSPEYTRYSAIPDISERPSAETEKNYADIAGLWVSGSGGDYMYLSIEPYGMFQVYDADHAVRTMGFVGIVENDGKLSYYLESSGIWRGSFVIENGKMLFNNLSKSPSDDFGDYVRAETESSELYR